MGRGSGGRCCVTVVIVVTPSHWTLVALWNLPDSPRVFGHDPSLLEVNIERRGVRSTDDMA